jgi:hypothetical protein
MKKVNLGAISPPDIKRSVAPDASGLHLGYHRIFLAVM